MQAVFEQQIQMVDARRPLLLKQEPCLEVLFGHLLAEKTNRSRRAAVLDY